MFGDDNVCTATLDGDLVDLLRHTLPDVAVHTVTAVRDEVPAYSEGLGEQMAGTIEQAVQMALAGFLRVAGRAEDPGTPLPPTVEGAYALGQGEARAGRSADALLSAYRVGARVSWRELSATAVAAGVSAQAVASFAEMVFAYIDELSAASVAGHTDELETSGRVRQRYLDRLAVGPAARGARGRPDAGGRAGGLEAAADADRRAAARRRRSGRCSGWCRAGHSPRASRRPARGGAGRGAGARHGGPLAHPAAPGARRPARGGRAGPAVAGGAGVVRPGGAGAGAAATASRSTPTTTSRRWSSAPTPRRWPTCARAALAPLADVRPSTAEKLEATLRSWLLHQGRREDVAADLFIHPQTVRYRMGQLRELYGDRLEDPQTVLALTLALA